MTKRIIAELSMAALGMLGIGLCVLGTMTFQWDMATHGLLCFWFVLWIIKNET